MPIYKNENGILVEAERWVGTNTARIFDWVLRTNNVRVRWYPPISSDTSDAIPQWAYMPEHICIVYFAGAIMVRRMEWIVRDCTGHYEKYPEREFREKFKLGTYAESKSLIVRDDNGGYRVKSPLERSTP